MLVGTASGQPGGSVVSAVGKEYWESNGFVAATFRWDPGTLTVASGSSVTFVHGNTGPEPHTVTIARKAQLPGSFEARCIPCNVASGHLKNPNGPPIPANIKAYVLNRGAPGLDRPGDSIALLPRGPHSRAAIVVSAPPGTVLHYVWRSIPGCRARSS